MKQLQDIKNYLVIENGTIISQICNENIEINNNKIIVNDASSLQIVYLIDQVGNFSIDLEINGSLKLIETYNFKQDTTFIKNIDVTNNSNVLRYIDNQSTFNINAKVIENVKVMQDSDVKCAYVELSNSNIEMDVNYSLVKENANANIRLATLAKEKENKHITISIVHEAPYTTGIMNNYGVTKNEASLVIDGIGRIKKEIVSQIAIRQIKSLFLINYVKQKQTHIYILMNMMLKQVMGQVLVKLMKNIFIIYNHEV